MTCQRLAVRLALPAAGILVGLLAATAAHAQPEVNAVLPEDDRLDAPTATSVTLVFSDPVNPGTVSSSSIFLSDGVSTVPSTTTLFEGNTRAVLDPTAALLADTIYEVHVTGLLEDAIGNSFKPFLSRFRTAPGPTGERTLASVSTESDDAGVEATDGSSLTPAGDLDDDGIADWISGAPGRREEGQVQVGAALVYLGSPDSVERAQPDIIFTGVEEGDRTGVSVAGNFDFNGDGVPDILIGAEQVNRSNLPTGSGCEPGDPCGEGRVYLIFFDPGDAVHYPNLGNPAVTDVVGLDLVTNGIPGVVFEGAVLGDMAGFAVAGGGTINAGAGHDIAIGAPGSDAGGNDAGTAYVIFDDPGLQNATVVLDEVGMSVSGVQLFGGNPGDGVGHAVSFGEIFGEELVGAGSITSIAASGSDVAVTAPDADPDDGMGGTTTDGGTVFVADGGDLDDTIVDICSIGVSFPGVQIWGSQAGEHLGWSVSPGGDSRRNGQADLLIGSRDYDVGALVDAGRVVHTSGFLTAFSNFFADDVGSTVNGIQWHGEAAGDKLGSSVAGVGDLTGDGIDDVHLGAPFHDPVVNAVPLPDAGAVYMPAGQPVSNPLEGNHSVSSIGQTAPGEVLTGNQAGEQAGASVGKLGDADADGDNDASAGGPRKDRINVDAGVVYTVLDTEPAAVRECGSAGCTVADLANGAQIVVPANALSGTISLGVLGVDDPLRLPAPAPLGLGFYGGIELTPDQQALALPATIDVPIRPALEGQFQNGETLSLYYYDASGAVWVADGTVTVGPNPHYATRLSGNGARDSLRFYAIFLPDADGDDVRDVSDNCPSTPNPGQADGDADGAGDSCDNCAAVYNPSQADADSDGIGDACESRPVLRVSSDPLDNPDYPTIQGAVNAASVAGTRIRVEVGFGPYFENVVISDAPMMTILGIGSQGSGPLVEVDGGFDVLDPSGRVRIENFRITGGSGVSAGADTELVDLTFENLFLAVELSGGNHRALGLSVESTVDMGVDVDESATLTLEQSVLRGQSNTGLTVGGAAFVENTLVVQAGTGIAVLATGSLELRFSTIVEASGVGIGLELPGSTTLDHAIVWGNSGGDLEGVACGSVSWSDTRTPDCSAVNDNVSEDPLLDGEYRLPPGSVAADVGPPPTSFEGPCRDFHGDVRQADNDGDGIVLADMGAVEGSAPLEETPGEVQGVVFVDKDTLSWDVEPDADSYHAYRDGLSAVGTGPFGECIDPIDPDPTDTSLEDTAVPAPGAGFAYVITAANASLFDEGTMGFGSCAERTNDNPCP